MGHTFPGKKIACARCGDPLKPTARRVAIVEKDRPVYCSRKCRREGSVVELTCTICEITFPRAASRPTPKRPFCSTECRNKGNGKQRSGVEQECDGPNCEILVYRPANAAERYDNRFCSKECKWEWLRGREMVERPEKLCKQCGTIMRLTPDDVAHDKKFCSPKCGYENIRVDGETYRRVDAKTGYVWAYRAPGDRCYEHTLVMEKHIGRRLLPGETVHHKKGGFSGRSDNRIENLELWSGNHGKGHRVEDILEYAREMLAIYGTDDERDRYGTFAPGITPA